MFFIKEYVPASDIWPTAKSFEDRGYIEGLVRGYCIEVTTKEGVTDWLSCEYINGSPEMEFDDAYHRESFLDWGWKPTGRICFRGYGKEYYDPEERDWFVEVVE